MGKKVRLPKLRPLTYKNKKHKYKLNETVRKRRQAINEKINSGSNKRKNSIKKRALSKKRRFNILRIYRRYNNIKDCKKITRDMRYIDKKYNLKKTNDICGKKGTKNKAP
tara:strand:- start:1295 stop:1624 length:330 start_codon:yes stop_codon:yes gene_type:complete